MIFNLYADFYLFFLKWTVIFEGRGIIKTNFI